MSDKPDQPEDAQDIDLSVDAEAFSSPGAGVSGEAEGSPQAFYTYGTTCWGTPCA